MNKVSLGDRLKIPAETFNTFVDAAQDFLNRRHGVRSPGPATGYDGTVLIRNDSGSDLGRFSVLGIDDELVISSSANFDAFANGPVLIGVTPADLHVGRFAILAEPARNGAIAKAYVSGICPVKLDMGTGGTLADVKDGDATCLTVSPTGTAQILWKQYLTGPGGWGLVRFPFDWGPHWLAFDGIARIDSSDPDANFSGESRIIQTGNEGTRRQAFLLHAERPFAPSQFLRAALCFASEVQVTRSNTGGWGDWLKSSVQVAYFATTDFDVDSVIWNTAPEKTSQWTAARSAPVMMRYPTALTPGVSCTLISGGPYVDAGVVAQQVLTAPSEAELYYGLYVELEAGSYSPPWWTSYECQTDCDRWNSRVFLL